MSNKGMRLNEVEIMETGEVYRRGRGGEVDGLDGDGELGELVQQGGNVQETGNNSDAAKKKKDGRHDDLRKEIAFVEHTWPLAQLYEHYHTNLETGLNFDQVKANRAAFGTNSLTPPVLTPWWVKYLLQYTNFFSLLLLVAGGLCFVAYFLDKREDVENLYLGCILFVVVIITSTFAYLQEAKSEHVMESLTKLIPTKCHVIRDGYHNVIDAGEVVCGDVVLLADGDRVPADLRIITSDDLKVDNSSLTGESEPVDRSPDLLEDSEGRTITQPLEANNLAFYTTIVASGHAKGIAIAVGDTTIMGQIAGLTIQTANLQTPIGREINMFVYRIAALAICMGVLFGILSLVVGNALLETVVFSIGVIVANVPEGLMATVTVSLSLAARRMYTKNVLVKQLESVETLGSTTVIASDKTGTLTQNRMTVQHMWYDCQTYATAAPRNRIEWEAMFKEPTFDIYDPENPTFQKLQLICTLCNNASFVSGAGSIDMEAEMQKPGFNLLALNCTGDASEQGLLKFVEPIRSARTVRMVWPKLFEIKFNSLNKWQLSVHKHDGGYPPVLVLKGAPERVLAKCDKILMHGRPQPLTPEIRQAYQKSYEQLGGYGERVLGFAYNDLTGYSNDYPFSTKPETNFPVDNLTFVGLVSLIDPPREGVKEAVAKCKSGGIQVYMVTGDHPITAQAIAVDVGIIDEDKLRSGKATVITGDDIRHWMDLDSRALQEAKWDEALNHEQLVFARVSPAHKLLIVENCQRRGEIVAVTGDGVNDAPALKKADIGVAMGISGKDVTKEAADMVLMDDNFASIVLGVEEGRLIFDNLKKTICYALTVNIPELIPFLCNVVLGIPLPLSTVLMLAICLGTDMFPAIALAYEEKEADIMERPPRNANVDRLVTGRLIFHAYLIIGIVQTFAGFLAYMAVLNDYGYVPGILVGLDTSLDFEGNSVICTISNDVPIKCGYGCGAPDYTVGFPNLNDYCIDGCTIPLDPAIQDPFSEFDTNGFKGPEYCNLTCSSPPSMFSGGVLPVQCSDSSLVDIIGFPNRTNLGTPYAPVGGWYWWAGRKQPMPNWYYQSQVVYFSQSAYFFACVVTQWANLIVCKTRKLSVFQQGMSNYVLNFSLLFELGIAFFLLYTPGVQTIFSTRPILAIYWLCGTPFMLGIFGLGELRKRIIRSYPGGWMDRWTFW